MDGWCGRWKGYSVRADCQFTVSGQSQPGAGRHASQGLITAASVAFANRFSDDMDVWQRIATDYEIFAEQADSLNGPTPGAFDENHAMQYHFIANAAVRPSAIRRAMPKAKRIIVIEKAFQIGIGGIVSENVQGAISGLDIACYSVIAGLGGRPITKSSLHSLFEDAMAGGLEPLTFLDLDNEVVERETIREGASS